MADKKADLAGPGISTYPEVEKILPTDYRPLLDTKETAKAHLRGQAATSRRTSARS